MFGLFGNDDVIDDDDGSDVNDVDVVMKDDCLVGK